MKLSIAGYNSPAANWENEPEGDDYPGTTELSRTYIDSVEELQGHEVPQGESSNLALVECEERDEDAPKPRPRRNRARKANYSSN